MKIFRSAIVLCAGAILISCVNAQRETENALRGER